MFVEEDCRSFGVFAAGGDFGGGRGESGFLVGNGGLWWNDAQGRGRREQRVRFFGDNAVLAFDSKDMEWFANMLKIMGEEKGMEFMEKLVRQDLRLVSGHSLGAQLLAAGEFYIHVGVFPFRVELMKEDGAPIDWVPLDPVIAYAKPASLSAKAPHPNAAKLLVNFLFSKEGQGVIAKFGRITTRSDVPARFPKMRIADKVHPSDISLAEDFAKYNKKFRKTFFKGKR